MHDECVGELSSNRNRTPKTAAVLCDTPGPLLKHIYREILDLEQAERPGGIGFVNWIDVLVGPVGNKFCFVHGRFWGPISRALGRKLQIIRQALILENPLVRLLPIICLAWKSPSPSNVLADKQRGYF